MQTLSDSGWNGVRTYCDIRWLALVILSCDVASREMSQQNLKNNADLSVSSMIWLNFNLTTKGQFSSLSFFLTSILSTSFNILSRVFAVYLLLLSLFRGFLGFCQIVILGLFLFVIVWNTSTQIIFTCPFWGLPLSIHAWLLFSSGTSMGSLSKLT